MKKKMKRALAILMLLIMAMSVMSGCKKAEEVEESWESSEESEERSSTVAFDRNVDKNANESSEESSEEAEESSEESSVEAADDGKFRNPLTGEVTEEDLSHNRPYVFMCNNIWMAMPQRGISQADMIMELLEEGDVTRMMAFYMDPSEVGDIGTIRSARAYNVDVAMGYDAILVHCGGSGEALNMIDEYGVPDICQIHGTCTYEAFYRDPSHSSYGTEHTLFAVGEYIVDSAENYMGYRTELRDDYDNTFGLSFAADAVNQCTETAESIVNMYAGTKTSTFEYDAETNLYTMYEYGTEYTDGGVDNVRFSNVICIFAYTYLQSDGVHLTIELDEGDGYFFTGGKVVPIHWTKDGYYDVFHYTLEDGTPLKLTPGKTFVCVNQTGSSSSKYNGTVDWE